MFKIFTNLQPNTNFLLAGCGGGHDCFVGLPLYFKLKQYYSNVFIANLSFTDPKHLNKFPKITDTCFDIYFDKELEHELEHENNQFMSTCSYFPEYELSRELSEHIYAFIDEGMNEYEIAYIELIKKLKIDVIILCDGGCDSIMVGNEERLGTNVEDTMSVITVKKLLDAKIISAAYLLLLGATVDTFHGIYAIHRIDFITNIEELIKSNALIEQMLLTINTSDPNSAAVIKYRQIVEACTPFNSIVNSSICARLDGLYGNVLPPLLIKNGTKRCDKQYFELDDYLVTYYLIDLPKIVDRMCYKHLIEGLDSSDDIDDAIMTYNSKLWPTINID